MKQVAVLFARKDSVYKTLPQCDVWDIDRDARKWLGGASIVGHPPCRAWGQLSGMAKPRPDEKELARWTVDQIRKWGGVLEHPAQSKLWKDKDLPEPGLLVDKWGGWTFEAEQYRWGHKVHKLTRFYIVGVGIGELPDVPPMPTQRPKYSFAGAPSWSHGRIPGKKYLPGISKAEREHTPDALALWLVELAMRCKVTHGRK